MLGNPEDRFSRILAQILLAMIFSLPTGVRPMSSLIWALAPFCSNTFTASWARLEAAICRAVPLSNSEHLLSISKQNKDYQLAAP